MIIDERLEASCDRLQDSWGTGIDCSIYSGSKESLSKFKQQLQEFKKQKEKGTLDTEEVSDLIQTLYKINKNKQDNDIFNKIKVNYTKLTDVKNDNYFADKKLEENQKKLSNIKRGNKTLIALVIVLSIILVVLFGVYIK
jgi:hypothetical protein